MERKTKRWGGVLAAALGAGVILGGCAGTMSGDGMMQKDKSMMGTDKGMMNENKGAMEKK
jgi:hypothetical protein